MKPQRVELPEFKIIGIEIRTTNENGQSRTDISELWKRFYKEDIKNKIPNKIDSDVIGLYTDYESDFRKPYTMIIGCRVSSLDELPGGMVGKAILSANYSVFNVRGKLPDELINTWKQIWSSDMSRAYTADFEVYGKRSEDRENAEMEVFLSVK